MFDRKYGSILSGAISIGLVGSLSGCAESKAPAAAVHVSARPAEAEVPVVRIKEMQLERLLEIPGELKAFQNVEIKAKVQGYVSWIGVDRGSTVRKDAKLLAIFCPELEEHTREEDSKYSSAVSSLAKSRAALQSTKSKLLEAKARFDADTLTLSRLKETEAKMAGAIAQNDIDVQTKTVESDAARLASMQSEVDSYAAVVNADQSNVAAAANVRKGVKAMQAYLTVEAPFDGMITERNVHVGSMVGPQESRDLCLVRIQQRKVLRLIVALPEDSVGGVKGGQHVTFKVPAFPGQVFAGIVARPAYAIDTATRTMPVELNVDNSDGHLEPGMFATVQWPVSRMVKSLFVPATAVSTDLQGTYVNLVKDGTLERVIVQKGQPMKDYVEITGSVAAGDEIALTASDEMKPGTHVSVKLTDPDRKVN